MFVVRCLRDATFGAKPGAALMAGPVQRLDQRLMRRSARTRSPGAGPDARRDHAGGELLPALAAHRRRARRCGGRPGRRAAGRGVARDRDRGRLSRTAPPSCSCATAPAVGGSAPALIPHAALDVVPLRATAPPRSRSPRAPARAAAAAGAVLGRWRARLPTRACIPAFTIRATSQRAPRSGSARRMLASACPTGLATSAGAGGKCRAMTAGRAQPGSSAGCRAFARCARIERAWLRADLVAGVGPRGDPRSAGHGLRAAGGASGGHRPLHDDRLPGRLCGVRALAGAGARSRLLDLAVDPRRDHAAAGGRRSRRPRSRWPGCSRCWSDSPRSGSASGSSGSSPTSSRRRCRSDT